MGKKIINNYYFKLIISAFLAGIVMSIASFELIALKKEDHFILGAFLQGFGLLTILGLGLYSFPGHFNDIFYEKNKKQVLINQLIAIVINMLTIIGTGFIFRVMTNHNEELIKTAIELVETRFITFRTITGKEWYMTLISAINCGLILGAGGFLFKKAPNAILKVFLVFFFVGLYVVCGFENILTNTFYISFANSWNGSTAINILVVTIGNFIGIVGISALLKLVIENKKEEVK